MTGYAIGAITAGVFLARRPVRRKALGSLLAWSFYLPAYLVIGFAESLAVAMAGAFIAALGESTAVVLLNSAAQEDVPDRVLGRVMGVISLVHRGAHATGLLLIAPLFAVVEPEYVFATPRCRSRSSRSRCAAWALTTPSRSRSSSTRDGSNPSILSTAPAAPDGGPAGISPTSSDPATSIPRASASSTILATISCERRRLPVGHVHAHLDEPRAWKVEPEGADAGEAAVALAHDARRSRAHASTSSERRLTLKATSGLRTPTSTPPAVGCRRSGPRSGRSSPASIRRWSSSGPPRRKNAGSRPSSVRRP